MKWILWTLLTISVGGNGLQWAIGAEQHKIIESQIAWRADLRKKPMIIGKDRKTGDIYVNAPYMQPGEYAKFPKFCGREASL